MKERELRAKSRCALCGEGVGHDNNLMFYTVTIRRYVLDLPALRRQTGMEMMMGGHVALAQVMGPNEDLAHEVDTPTELTVCMECAATPREAINIAELHERAGVRAMADEAVNDG